MTEKSSQMDGVADVYCSCSNSQMFFCQDDDESYSRHADDNDAQSDVIQEAIRNDDLRRLQQVERAAAEASILLAAKIISARIYRSYEDAYDWCIEQVTKL